jgi:predicted small lipoprotein YifL
MRRSRSLIRSFMAAASLTALAACGPEGARSGGPDLSVAVVPPVEREVQPGDTMEVGQLNDSFDRAALERVAAAEDETYLPPDAYAGSAIPADTPRMPMPTPVHLDLSPAEAYRIAATGGRPARDPLADGSRSFGFDRPRPDFAAERVARWAEREARAVRPPTAPSDQGGPVPYNDVVKYSTE